MATIRRQRSPKIVRHLSRRLPAFFPFSIASRLRHLRFGPMSFSAGRAASLSGRLTNPCMTSSWKKRAKLADSGVSRGEWRIRGLPRLPQKELSHQSLCHRIWFRWTDIPPLIELHHRHHTGDPRTNKRPTHSMWIRVANVASCIPWAASPS